MGAVPRKPAGKKWTFLISKIRYVVVGTSGKCHIECPVLGVSAYGKSVSNIDFSSSSNEI